MNSSLEEQFFIEDSSGLTPLSQINDIIKEVRAFIPEKASCFTHWY